MATAAVSRLKLDQQSASTANGRRRKRNVANTRPFLAYEVGLDDETTKNDHSKAVLVIGASR